MRAMVLERAGEPLRACEVAEPEPGPGQVLIEVEACGVCRTDLHILDGELPAPKLPLVLGHQVVGAVLARGPGCERLERGERVGVPWLGWACGECRHCRAGRENLCELARFTGYTLDGGYAERMLADERFCLRLGERRPALEAAPLLCGGAIGLRALRMCGEPERLGLLGFGSSAHIVCQLARAEGRRVFALTRAGDADAQALARRLGAVWAGAIDELATELDAVIVFAPDGGLVPRALRAVGPGGTVVCAGIRMSEIPAFPYEILWRERQLRSVANLTRRDGEELLALAAAVGVETTTAVHPLAAANEALDDLRGGRVVGSAVLSVDSGSRSADTG